MKFLILLPWIYLLLGIYFSIEFVWFLWNIEDKSTIAFKKLLKEHPVIASVTTILYLAAYILLWPFSLKDGYDFDISKL